MKKRSLRCLLIACMLVGLVGVCACEESSYHTIYYYHENGQYSDEVGRCDMISIEENEHYRLYVIPQKVGHSFTGLYDSPTGGTQWVDANGNSVSVYPKNSDTTLYAQFSANRYEVTLDFQGATGVEQYRQITQTYGERFSQFPANLYKLNYTFRGWFTKPNCGGKQVADENGEPIANFYFNANNFNFVTEQSDYRIYAGFEVKKVQVTLDLGVGLSLETVSVGHGTPANEITSVTQSFEGRYAVAWSLTPNGTEFKGEIVDPITLFAIGWTPVLSLDGNGGGEYERISQRVGTELSLPLPERAGYEFAGWYAADGTRTEVSQMPAQDLNLRAGWYEIKTENLTVTDSYTTQGLKVDEKTELERLNINLSHLLPADYEGTVQITLNVNIRYTGRYVETEWRKPNLQLYYLSESGFGGQVDVNEFNEHLYFGFFMEARSERKDYSYSQEVLLKGNTLYAVVCPLVGATDYHLKNFTVQVTYVDYPNLIL